jgi:hypothetical protein
VDVCITKIIENFWYALSYFLVDLAFRSAGDRSADPIKGIIKSLLSGFLAIFIMCEILKNELM